MRFLRAVAALFALWLAAAPAQAQSRTEAVRLANAAERQGRELRAMLEGILNGGAGGGQAGTAQAKEYVQSLNVALERLQRAVNRAANPKKARPQMQGVMKRAGVLNAAFRGQKGFRGEAENRWRRLRSDLNLLARYYGLRKAEGG